MKDSARDSSVRTEFFFGMPFQHKRHGDNENLDIGEGDNVGKNKTFERLELQKKSRFIEFSARADLIGGIEIDPALRYRPDFLETAIRITEIVSCAF